MLKTTLRTGRCMLIAVLTLALGGQWAVLQTVAWGLMIVDFSHRETISVAVQRTFDGKHPCSICKQVQDGQQSEKKSGRTVSVEKVQLFYEASVRFLPPLAVELDEVIADEMATVRTEKPAIPPPRFT